MAEREAGSFFQRLVLPGLAFKAVVIGGGYATGREIAEFFLGSGPLGGLFGLLLAMAIWSLVCALTFAFAGLVRATDYRHFFGELLGRGWVLFEIVYVLLMILVLAVMAAAAGEIGAALFGWPGWIGTALLMASTIGVTTFGTAAAEGMFRYSSLLIYGVYALFLLLCLWSFGERIGPQLSGARPGSGWVAGGISYASYNLIGAVAILPFLRHQTTRRDALLSGLLAGPLAMLPALLFFLCMIAFYPAIGDAALPSDYLLQRLDAPWFQFLFQAMIFSALLETGVGMVNAIDERAAAAAAERGRPLPRVARFALSAVVVVGSGALAARFGFVELIASGYGAFGWVMLTMFVAPLVTVGAWRLFVHRPSGPAVRTEP